MVEVFQHSFDIVRIIVVSEVDYKLSGFLSNDQKTYPESCFVSITNLETTEKCFFEPDGVLDEH